MPKLVTDFVTINQNHQPSPKFARYLITWDEKKYQNNRKNGIEKDIFTLKRENYSQTTPLTQCSPKTTLIGRFPTGGIAQNAADKDSKQALTWK